MIYSIQSSTSYAVFWHFWATESSGFYLWIPLLLLAKCPCQQEAFPSQLDSLSASTAASYLVLSLGNYSSKAFTSFHANLRSILPLLVRVSIAVLKQHVHKQFLEERMYFILYCSGKSGQEPGARDWKRRHKWGTLTGLLSIPCSACFLMPSGTTCPGVALPSMTWMLLHQSLLQIAYRAIWWMHFLN